jgi:xylulokinase
MTYLCADIGTSSLKAALIGPDGVQHAFARVSYPLAGRGSGGPFRGSAFFAEDWKTALGTAAAALRRQCDKPVAAVCVSANGPTFVPVGADGKAFPPLLWYNAGNAGKLTGASLFLPHIKTFITENRALYDKTAAIFSCQEWIAHELGAEAVTVLPGERYEPYYWDEAQCRAIGCDIRKFPPFTPLGAVIGRTNKEAEAAFSLKKDIPIIAGGPDFIMALIGTGVLHDGLVCDRAGTSEGINVCSKTPAASPLLRTLPHVSRDMFNIGALIPSSGILFDNYRRDTLQDRRDYKEHLDALLKNASLSEKDIAGRKILLAMARQVKEKIAVLRENGFPITEMRVCGGQAKNALWNKMKAKITGVTLAIPEITDGELAGNACLCAAATGEADGLARAVQRIVRIRERCAP